MKKTVYSAEIDKRSEVSNILNLSFYSVANIYTVKKLFLLSLLLLGNDFLTVSDDPSFLGIIFGNDKLHFLSVINRKIPDK